jgi:hypothetical protein
MLMQRLVPRLVILSAVVMSLAVTPVRAASPAEIAADLEGVPIAVEQIPDFFCHDRDYPTIHCFTSARRLEATLRGPGTGFAPAAVAAVDYVIVYSLTYYAGSYLYISQDYDTLALVGWNDRIRSYRGLNSELGRFWTDWFHGGTALDICCNAFVPSLSATFDQKITSVYRR